MEKVYVYIHTTIELKLLCVYLSTIPCNINSELDIRNN